MLSGTTTEEEISIEIPRMITDPLGSLVSLQSLFSTQALEKGYESWRYTIENPNRFSVSTNKAGKFVLEIKNGSVTFYASRDKEIKNINLSGDDISTILVKFCKALERSAYCEIYTTEYEAGNSNKKKFIYRFKICEGRIVRHYLDSENYQSLCGSDGDL